jgi:hypothetical protein
MRIVPLMFLLPAYFNGVVDVTSLGTTTDIADACLKYKPDTLALEVLFPAQTDVCPWGVGDNLATGTNGVLTARSEQLESLALPEHAIICGLTFDFGGLQPGEIQNIIYDDHFFFDFNDIVMAASLGPAVDRLPPKDGLHTYDWSELVGMEYHIDTEGETYCLGQEDGTSDCVIPGTETEGEISLKFDPAVVTGLSLSAVQHDRYDFSFVTTGDDNPESDCMHEEFGFSVQVPYLQGY